MSGLRLLFLGPPRLEWNGEPVTLDNRKALALLAYLAVIGHCHSRDGLATMFWPDEDQSQARSRLRYSLWALKKALGEGWLAVERESIALEHSDRLWLDVVHFQSRLAACWEHSHPLDEVCPACLTLLSEAVELYRGDFLAGFSLVDAPDFDEWQFFQTESLRRELAGILERLVGGHSAQAEYEPAIGYARRWVGLDPLHEPAHRQLMQVYAWAGQPAAALRQYRECVRLLETELGVAPEAATIDLYETIKAKRVLPTPRSRLGPKLVERTAEEQEENKGVRISNPFFHRGPIRDKAYFFGREPEIGQMLSLLGNGQNVSLVGQRRIGKTSLLFHLADPEILVRHGLSPSEFLFVYIDCGGLTTLDQSGLYGALLEEIADALADCDLPHDRLEGLGKARPLTYRAFERAVRGLTRQGLKLVILLDEFERMSYNPQLDPDFFSGLRALTARYPIAYVTASMQPLLELTYANASALSSPFFNIFASTRLGLFTEPEARELLTGLATIARVTFAPPTLDFMLDLAGPHPLFLQIVGFHAFELGQAKGASLTDEDYPKLRHRFNTSVEEHFGYYWRNLSDEERHVLAMLSASRGSQWEIVRRLEQCCLILHRDESYDYLSSTFRAFVQSQPVSGLLQAGPVTINERQHYALLHGQVLNLSQTQYSLLVYLVERAGQVITNEELEHAVWGETFVEDPERLKSVIKGLRQALGVEAVRLENVRGVGYKFSP